MVKKGVEKLKRGVENNGLSVSQKEVLRLLLEEYKTPKEIAKIRNTSDKAVYKIIKKLKDKGYIKGVEKGSYIKGSVVVGYEQVKKKTYRLHGQNYKIGIISYGDFYYSLLKTRDRIILDNNTIMLYEDCLIVYYNKDFWGDSVEEAVKNSINYTNLFITKLENRLKVVLRTNLKLEIKEFRGEIAKTGDEVAKELNLKGEKIKIYDENGVLRLLVDNSFNYDELEAVSKYHKEDMKKIEEKYLDLIKTDIKLSEVETHLKSLYNLDKDTKLKLDKLSEIVGNMSVIQNNSLLMIQELIREVYKR